MFTVITENDISQWEDETGKIYHFPKRYLKLLQPGTKVIYYKGRIQSKAFSASRLSAEPHYFGIATIGDHYPDEQSTKGDLFAFINDYQLFETPVLIKDNSNQYFEEIPKEKQSNYWRNGTRSISEETYKRILSKATVLPTTNLSETIDQQFFQTYIEGEKKKIFTTIYERDPNLRKQAILIHGSSCLACGFNFEKTYGEYGKGFIHIHHINPISTTGGPTKVNPATDLIPLCANCHAIAHRKKHYCLSLDDLKQLIKN
ncbi:HNH endonuclease [Methylobacillus gramineus]|uniref:HNH endonuclease n=1 Tax=Methylobacillus gramineus TaxID=755169 RepID=UPI001CFF8176|nr:HNH endonuclease [Methylobacillus gramineus]MCB5186143.1 HNH endonuclease [Methylobacillus gramineus]